MESRLVPRHSSDLLPDSLSTVLLVLPDRFEIETQLVDISSQGMKLSIPPTAVPLAIPRKAETVEVVFRASGLRVTCRCIYSSYNPDGSISMGMYVFDPGQQDRLRTLLAEIP
ncbi:PilZ domain-containing protein [Geobacter sp. FeAm09]|uniref:PilZ domain-containing protein n=1 Tax=Geobacter sp. FeAm09 TaxID=2597769 RepID=UPI00143D047B|nr:PilZ domain-containing protein [Geobacter sp. FeAm09]